MYGSCDAQRRRAPPYFVQHLGGLGADAFAVTGGEDDADARDVVLDWRIELGEQVADRLFFHVGFSLARIQIRRIGCCQAN